MYKVKIYNSPILSAKTVGDVSYMVKSIEILNSILWTETIMSSKHPEYNPKTNKKEYSISLGRDLTSASRRNPNRWVVGIILDGTKLSNKYTIEPFSYTGTLFENGNKVGNLRIKELRKYTDETYVLSLVNWASFYVNKEVFDNLEQTIQSLPEETKQEKKLKFQSGGKVKNRYGKKLEYKYVFDTKNGSPPLEVEGLPSNVRSALSNHYMDESEERIWLGESQKRVDVSGCIKGLVLPQKVYKEFQDKNCTDDEIIQLRTLIRDCAGPNYTVATY